MAKRGAKRSAKRAVKNARPRRAIALSRSKKTAAAAGDGFRIDVDLDEAQRAAERVRGWLVSLRDRHAGLAAYEYTRHVRIIPASTTYSHPILTLGTRFADSEDHLLATYLHEQMHWYLWRFGGLDHDPVAPFFDELVRRYPKAPTRLPDGARNYEQTYVHIVVCWLELQAVAEFIGWERAAALAETNFGYRWIYRTVVRDRDALGQLFQAHGLWPMTPAPVLLATPQNAPAPKRIAAKPRAKATKTPATPRDARQKTRAAKTPSRMPRGRRTPPARGGTRAD